VVGDSIDAKKIDDLARALARPEAWPACTTDVEAIQTHISHVFLVGERVYKLRKNVELPFLDFSTRDRRNADCQNEVELNRRLAPDVYLGIAPILQDAAQVHVGPVVVSMDAALPDPNVEHVVVMRRLPAGHDVLSMLERGTLEVRHLEAIAERLTDFHAAHGLGRPAPWSAPDWQERIREPVVACLESLAESKMLPADRLAELESKTRERLAVLEPRFESRRTDGRAVDAHGDLHLDHVWFEDGSDAPLIIDCIEFSEDLRHIDTASEVAFLAMDLRYRGRDDLAEAFLHAYASRTDDYDLFGTVDFYSAYRALVRAKVAALASLQTSIDPGQQAKARASAENHVALAERCLETSASDGLIVLCGTVGSGKSTVARGLALAGHGIPIASDRVRKALAGLSATTHSGTATDEGIYRPEQTDAVYEALLERADSVTQSGRTAILDASFATRERRDAVRRWAAERGLPIRLVEVRCDREIALSRLEQRERRGLDPSDAGPDFLATSESRFEPPNEWPASDRQIIWSSSAPPASSRA